MANANCLSIEVAYARPEIQIVIPLVVDTGCTVKDAIYQSEILTQHTEIDLSVNRVGIFGKIISLETLVKDGDRVEIYRPLAKNPKVARMLRVKSLKPIKQASK